jgi:hypothetical protein
MRITITPQNRPRLVSMIEQAADGYILTLNEPTRSLAQNALFHELCGAIAKSRFKWMGKSRTAAEWKVLLVSGHGQATGQGSEVVPGLEGELVNIREPTSRMSIKRANSLIEYVEAFCTVNEIKLPYYGEQ